MSVGAAPSLIGWSGERGDAAARIVSIVVHYAGIDDTLGCLRSLVALDEPGHAIVVVDNGSAPEARDTIEAEFDGRVTVIDAAGNRGYGGGANLGIDWARRNGASYAWVLNNDTVVRKGSLSSLVRAMDEHDDLGAASPLIVAPVGPEAPEGIWFAGATLDLRHAAPRHLTAALPPDPPMVVDTGFVTGCAMLLRLAAVRDVGDFWTDLFLYWEDVDLSIRMRAAGWRLALVPAATVEHRIHGSVTSDVVEYYWFRNAVLVVGRHSGPGGALRVLCPLGHRIARRWMAALLKGRRPFPRSETRGLVAGVLGEARIRSVARAVEPSRVIEPRD